MADNKKGHWYTDKQGNHYFVEDGQSPKEGWEASKRRKMISGGKYMADEGDGSEPREISKDEYDKYEADEGDFDLTNDDDFGDFDEGSEISNEDIVDNAIKDYADSLGIDVSELLQDSSNERNLVDTIMLEFEDSNQNISVDDAENMLQAYINSYFNGSEDDSELERETQEALDKSDYVMNDKGQAVPRKYNEKYGEKSSEYEEEPNPMNEFSGPDKEGSSYAELDETLTPNDLKQLEKYANRYEYNLDALKEEVMKGVKERLAKGDSLTNAKNDAMEDVLESVVAAGGREDFLKDKIKEQSPDSDLMNPNNPKYEGKSRSAITNAKEVYDGGTIHNFDRDTDERWSIIEYIPYGALQDGDNRKLYGIVTDYDGSDAPNTGAIVGVDLEDAKEQLERQQQLAREGSERYMKRGKWDEDWFKMLADDSYDWDDETKSHYSEKYGWDFSKPWEEQEHIKGSKKPEEKEPKIRTIRDLKYEQDNRDYGQDKRPQKRVK